MRLSAIPTPRPTVTPSLVPSSLNLTPADASAGNSDADTTTAVSDNWGYIATAIVLVVVLCVLICVTRCASRETRKLGNPVRPESDPNARFSAWSDPPADVESQGQPVQQKQIQHEPASLAYRPQPARGTQTGAPAPDSDSEAGYVWDVEGVQSRPLDDPDDPTMRASIARSQRVSTGSMGFVAPLSATKHSNERARITSSSAIDWDADAVGVEPQAGLAYTSEVSETVHVQQMVSKRPKASPMFIKTIIDFDDLGIGEESVVDEESIVDLDAPGSPTRPNAMRSPDPPPEDVDRRLSWGHVDSSSRQPQQPLAMPTPSTSQKQQRQRQRQQPCPQRPSLRPPQCSSCLAMLLPGQPCPLRGCRQQVRAEALRAHIDSRGASAPNSMPPPGSMRGHDEDSARPSQSMSQSMPQNTLDRVGSGDHAVVDAFERRPTVQFSDDEPERRIPSQDQRGRRNTKDLLKQAAADMGRQLKFAVVASEDARPGARPAWQILDG